MLLSLLNVIVVSLKRNDAEMIILYLSDLITTTDTLIDVVTMGNFEGFLLADHRAQ